MKDLAWSNSEKKICLTFGGNLHTSIWLDNPLCELSQFLQFHKISTAPQQEQSQTNQEPTKINKTVVNKNHLHCIYTVIKCETIIILVVLWITNQQKKRNVYFKGEQWNNYLCVVWFNAPHKERITAAIKKMGYINNLVWIIIFQLSKVYNIEVHIEMNLVNFQFPLQSFLFTRFGRQKKK